jgi:hypothetical protein
MPQPKVLARGLLLLSLLVALLAAPVMFAARMEREREILELHENRRRNK